MNFDAFCVKFSETLSRMFPVFCKVRFVAFSVALKPMQPVLCNGPDDPFVPIEQFNQDAFTVPAPNGTSAFTNAIERLLLIEKFVSAVTFWLANPVMPAPPVRQRTATVPVNETTMAAMSRN